MNKDLKLPNLNGWIIILICVLGIIYVGNYILDSEFQVKVCVNACDNIHIEGGMTSDIHKTLCHSIENSSFCQIIDTCYGGNRTVRQCGIRWYTLRQILSMNKLIEIKVF